MAMQLPYGFTTIDALAFVFFIVVWVSHHYVVNCSRWRVHTITAAMTTMREKRMENVVVRGESMIGAAPDRNTDEQVLAQYAKKLALLHALAAKHFTTGLNAYFFALAAATWFVSAWLFIAANLWVALVL